MNIDEQIKEVQEAIHSILVGGQSYKIGSRSLTRANLNELKAIEQELLSRKAQQQSSSLLDDCYVANFDGR